MISSLPICKKQVDGRRNQGNNTLPNGHKSKLSWGSSKLTMDNEEGIRQKGPSYQKQSSHHNPYQNVNTNFYRILKQIFHFYMETQKNPGE